MAVSRENSIRKRCSYNLVKTDLAKRSVDEKLKERGGVEGEKFQEVSLEEEAKINR